MKWTSKDTKIAVTLPDTLCAGAWTRAQVGEQSWEICWEPMLRTLYVRRDSVSPEVPLKYRTVVSKRFPGEMFAEILLEYVGGAVTGTQSLTCELAIHVPGLEGRTQAAGTQGEAVRAPMVGKLLKVNVIFGQQVERGQELLVIEAMKMENKIFAKNGGKVSELPVQACQQVSVGQLLVMLRAE